jgi:predicted ABC-type ATPase
MQDLLLIAGVNGAGKSTIFPSIQKSERVTGSFQPGHIEEGDFVNADDIERSTGSGQLGAARIAIERVYEKVRLGRNLALESTISGRGFVMGVIREAKKRGYRIYIVYVILYSPELSMARVVQRALQGKHYIPLANILTRYRKSVLNFFNLYRQEADFWVIVDNSGLKPNVLCWGGDVYANSRVYRDGEDSYKPLADILSFNEIDVTISDFGTESFSPYVFSNIQEQVERELAKRPPGMAVVYQEDGKMRFRTNLETKIPMS